MKPDKTNDKIDSLPKTPNNKYTREENLAIITNSSETIVDVIKMVLMMWVELGNFGELI